MNKDLKKRLAELKKPSAAKTAVGAIRRKERISTEQAVKIPTDEVRATRKVELDEREGTNREAQSATGTMSVGLPGLSEEAQYAQQTRDNNVARSQNPQRKVDEEGGETIGEIVADLAKRAEFENYTADDLWPHLMDELDRRNLHPEEKSNRTDIDKSAVRGVS